MQPTINVSKKESQMAGKAPPTWSQYGIKGKKISLGTLLNLPVISPYFPTRFRIEKGLCCTNPFTISPILMIRSISVSRSSPTNTIWLRNGHGLIIELFRGRIGAQVNQQSILVSRSEGFWCPTLHLGTNCGYVDNILAYPKDWSWKMSTNCVAQRKCSSKVGCLITWSESRWPKICRKEPAVIPVKYILGAFLRSVICKLDKYVYSDTNDTLVEEHKE